MKSVGLRLDTSHISGEQPSPVTFQVKNKTKQNEQKNQLGKTTKVPIYAQYISHSLPV